MAEPNAQTRANRSRPSPQVAVGKSLFQWATQALRSSSARRHHRELRTGGVLAGVENGQMSSASGEGPISLGARRGPVLHSPKDVFCPSQRLLHVVTNVFASDDIFKLGLPNQLRGLLPSPTENQSPLGR